MPYDVVGDLAQVLGADPDASGWEPAKAIFALVLKGGTVEAANMLVKVRERTNGEAVHMSSGVFSRWFDTKFLHLMAELLARGKAYVREMPRSLPGVLSGRTDWRVFESATVRLPRSMAHEFPSTGKTVALKLHVEHSLGAENVVDWHITAAHRRERRRLTVDAFCPGDGVLLDAADISCDVLQQCGARDVQYVVRLERRWKRHLDRSLVAPESGEWDDVFDALELMGAGGSRPIPETPMDVDVRLGEVVSGFSARLVNVATPEGWRVYLTNVPRSTHDAAAVAFLYALRPSVAPHIDLVRSGCEHDQIYARRPVSARILVHVAMLSSLLAHAVAHAEHVDQGCRGEEVVRPTVARPPVCPMSIWEMGRTSARNIADLLAGDPEPGHDWQRVSALLHRGGSALSWRTRPRPIDDAKGRNAEGRALWRRTVPPPRVLTPPKWRFPPT